MFGISLGGSKSKSSSSPWGPQQPFLTDVWGNAQQLFRNAQAPASALGSSQLGYSNQLMPGLGSAFNYWNSAMNGDPEFLASILRDPYRALTESTLPGITANGIGMNTFGGGSRGEIQSAIAQRGFMDRATDLAAQLRSDAAGNLSSLGQYGAQLGQSAIGFPLDLLSQYANMIQSGSWGGTNKGSNLGFRFGGGME